MGQNCLQVSVCSGQGISNYVSVHVLVDLCVLGNYSSISSMSHPIVLSPQIPTPVPFLLLLISLHYYLCLFLSCAFIPSSLLLSCALLLSLLPQKCLSVPFGMKHKESKRFLALFHLFLYLYVQLHLAPSCFHSLVLIFICTVFFFFFKSMN